MKYSASYRILVPQSVPSSERTSWAFKKAATAAMMLCHDRITHGSLEFRGLGSCFAWHLEHSTR